MSGNTNHLLGLHCYVLASGNRFRDIKLLAYQSCICFPFDHKDWTGHVLDRWILNVGMRFASWNRKSMFDSHSSGINYKLTDKSLTFLGSIINLLYHSLMFVLSLWLRKLLHYYLWKNSMGLTLIKLEFYFYILYY